MEKAVHSQNFETTEDEVDSINTKSSLLKLLLLLMKTKRLT